MEKALETEKFMAEAIKQARKALSVGEVPIGAVVVDEAGKIIGRGYNQMEKRKSQTAHAEVVAIKKACKKVGDWRLNGCTIYVTLEPCLMCLGLIKLSRIKKIVFGIKSPLFGFGYGEKGREKILGKDLLIAEGVQKGECKLLLQSFFKNVRNSFGTKQLYESVNRTWYSRESFSFFSASRMEITMLLNE